MSHLDKEQQELQIDAKEQSKDDQVSETQSNFETQSAIDSILNLELEKYVLRLYVINHTPRSVKAIQQIKQVCEERIPGRYDLEVIDIHENPEMMEEDQIFAIPTLIKRLPPPIQKLIGDLTNTERLIISLDL